MCPCRYLSGCKSLGPLSWKVFLVKLLCFLALVVRENYGKLLPKLHRVELLKEILDLSILSWLCLLREVLTGFSINMVNMPIYWFGESNHHSSL